MKRLAFGWQGSVVALAILVAAAQSPAQVIRRGRMGMVMAPGGSGTVNLPYINNSNGDMWYIYSDGAVRQQGGGQPIYSQGGMLTVDGNQFNVQNNSGTIDAATGELVLEGAANGNNNVTMTRRILFDKDNNFIRYIDVFHNPTNAVKTINANIQTSLNWGVQQSQLVADSKRKDQNIAWIGVTPTGRAALEIFAGKGSKVVPTINYQNGNNMVQASLSMDIPAGKDSALMHLHILTTSIDAGTKTVNDLQEAKILKTIPAPLRREIVNFPSSQGWVGDVEILRGDVFDVVELRGGDQLKGTLKQDTYKLSTFYGPVQLPVDRVVGIINVGQFRPRQLIVTSDGELFGGRLDQETIDIALSSGQTVQVPLAQIARVGYRKRAGEPEEWSFDKPMVMMRNGDRIEVQMPADAVEVATRYGTLKIAPASLAAIIFQSEDSGVHTVYLTDGSKFAGIVTTPQFDLKLNGAGPDQLVHFPTSGVARFQVSAKVPDAEDNAPTLTLSNQDVLIGTLTGQLKLDTTFDTIELSGPQIRKIQHPADAAAGDLQITLWDGTSISGQLEDQSVQCHLTSGPDLSVPIALVQDYNQPLPQPSAEMIKQVEEAVADLNADEFQQRDRAEAKLLALGPSVGSVLRDLRDKQAPEAQQRIDSILQKLQAMNKPAKANP